MWLIEKYLRDWQEELLEYDRPTSYERLLIEELNDRIERIKLEAMSFLDYFRPKTKKRLLAGEYVHWVHGHKRCSYIRQCVLSFPDWVNRKECEKFFERARRLTLLTGIEHSVDHIIPLNHPRVCGLSVPWNFQVMPKHANDSKGNAWCEWHGELFEDPEQLRLF